MRKRSYLVAFAAGGEAAEVVFCMVRDLSARGGKLELAPAQTVPDCFDLHIAGRQRPYRAHVKWRSATSVGVRFLGR